MNTNGTRKNAVLAMMCNLSQQEWEDNKSSVDRLKNQIKCHPLSQHLAIKSLKQEKLSLNSLKLIHLEYRNAIVKIFTDALLMAQFQTRQLEPRLAPGAKMAPRFLLTLNVLDEFGFSPCVGDDGYYCGNPRFAHYPLFENVLDQLGISILERQSFRSSKISEMVKGFLESSYNNYLDLLVLLAVAEEQVVLFSQPLRCALNHANINTEFGYYVVHGTTNDAALNAADDQHEDDLWIALTQAMTPADFNRLSEVANQYCQLWSEFWSYQLEHSWELNEEPVTHNVKAYLG